MKEPLTQRITTFSVRQSPIQNDDRFYSSGKFYVGVTLPNGDGVYLRNDGVVCRRMQTDPLQPFGTYFLTRKDAQEALDRYNASQDNNDKDNAAQT